MDRENQISDEESRAISYLKVVFIIMVLFLHSYQEKINLLSGTVEFDVPDWFHAFKWGISFGISDVAVPGFFIISAYLLYKKGYEYRKNLKKKCRSLFIPYVLMNTIWIIFFAFVQRVPILSVFFTNEDFLVSNWTIQDWVNAYIGIKTGAPILYPLWFVLNLMVLNLLAPVFQIAVDKFPRISAAVLLILWMFVGSSHIFCLRITAVCSWGGGCLLAKCKSQLRKSEAGKARLSIKSLFNIRYLAAIYFIALIVDITLRNWAYNMLIHRISMLMGLLFWYKIAVWRTRSDISPFAKFVSAYSFGIYIFHEMNMSMFQKICGRLLPASMGWQILEYMLIPIIIFFCCIFLCSILRKFLPALYKILTGAR